MAPSKRSPKSRARQRRMELAFSADIVATFRKNITPFVVSPHRPSGSFGPDETERVATFSRLFSDGHQHVIALERLAPTEAGEEPLHVITEMSGPINLFPLNSRVQKGGNKALNEGELTPVIDVDEEERIAHDRARDARAKRRAEKRRQIEFDELAESPHQPIASGSGTTGNRSRRVNRDHDSELGDLAQLVGNLGVGSITSSLLGNSGERRSDSTRVSLERRSRSTRVSLVPSIFS